MKPGMSSQNVLSATTDRSSCSTPVDSYVLCLGLEYQRHDWLEPMDGCARYDRPIAPDAPNSLH